MNFHKTLDIQSFTNTTVLIATTVAVANCTVQEASRKLLKTHEYEVDELYWTGCAVPTLYPH